VVPLEEDPREGGGLGNEGGRKWEGGRDREKSTVTLVEALDGFK